MEEKSNIFKEAKHIFQAKIPVVKLEANEEFHFKKVDITMMDQNHNGLKCVEIILEYQRIFPVLRPIFLVLKEMLFLANLNDPSQVH
jgi:DNA polymerase sigma